MGELDALRRLAVAVGHSSDTVQGMTGTREGGRIVDPEALAEALEPCEDLGRGRPRVRLGRIPGHVRKPGGHVLPRA
ncbi:hypothetical protein GCM10022245_23640 [Streptomyces mayteni]